MLRVCYAHRSLTARHTDRSVLRIPQNVEGNLLIASVQNVQTVQVVKNEGLGSEIFEHPATRLDSRRCENLIVPREIEG
jgi:hypothetical protein